MGDYTVEVSNKYLEELEEESRFLQALMDFGVDSWEGYELAQERVGND